MERTLKSAQLEMLALERFYPHYLREQAERVLFALSILFLSLTVFFNVLIETRYGLLWPIAEGLFLASFGLLLATILVEVYFNSLRMRLEKYHEISLATLLVIGFHHPRKKDLAKAFLHSDLGREVSKRLGISREMLHEFMHSKTPADIRIPEKGFFGDLAGHIHDEDPYFRDFLERLHVSKDNLVSSSDAVEKKHHQRLAGRPFMRKIFSRIEPPVFSIEHTTREEIDELERFYRIIITEQATQLLIAHFKEDMLEYVSEDARIMLMGQLIESCLTDHAKRHHGASVIMPADVRNFLIHQKSI